MPALKSSEKRLLLILALGVFLAANFFGWLWISRITSDQHRRRIALEGEKTKLEIWRTEAPAAEVRRQWIEENLRVPASDVARDDYLQRAVDDFVSGLGLTLSNNKPGPIKQDGHFLKTTYIGRVRGVWADVVSFLYKMQEPSELRFVPHFSLKPKKSESQEGGTDVECEFEIEKWWNPAGLTVETEGDPLVTNEQPAPTGVELPAQPAISDQPAATSAPGTPPAAPPNDAVAAAAETNDQPKPSNAN